MPTVTEMEPGRSSLPRTWPGGRPGSAQTAATSRITPSGTFTKNTQRQLSRPVSSPPITPPSAPPDAAAAVSRLSAFAFARGSGKPVVIRLRVVGTEDGAADALDEARRDHLPALLRQPRGQAGDGEEHQAADERALAAEQVADASPEQQEAGEGQRVAADHPLQPGGREPEALLHRRSATLTIEVSRTQTNCAAQATASRTPGRRGGASTGAAAATVLSTT